MDTDLMLLRQYAGQGDEQAFEAVVRRYVDIVFAAAMRQVRDNQQAEDVTQAVFVLLAQKAHKLGDNTLIGGWLINATRLVCKSAIRARQRREKHEQRAAAMRREAQKTDDSAEQLQISELIDEALSRLDQTSRGMLVMQYVEGRSGKEMAAVLGISEDAARKRASRALGELRRIFTRRGMALSSEMLGAGLMGLKMTAPEGLAIATTSAAASSAAAAGTGSAAALAKGAAVAMAMTKVQATVIGLVTALAVLGTGATVAVVVTQSRQASAEVAHAQPAAAAAAVPGAPAPARDPIRGVVLDPEGKPVEGAMILIGTEMRNAWAYGKPRGGPDATTDATGKFEVTPPAPKDGTFAIVVRSPKGFAEHRADELKADKPIQLVPWSRIEGTAYAGEKVAPRARVTIWRISGGLDPLRGLVEHQTSVTADAKGHFVFPEVVPGEIWMQAQPAGRRVGRERGVHWTYTQVEPGKTLQMSPGAIDSSPDVHSVIGRIETPAAIKDRVDWLEKGMLSYEGRVRVEGVRDDARHAPGETVAQYRAVEEAWGRTPEGKLAKEWIFGKEFAIQPDGTFRIEGVPAGATFNLNVRNFERIEEVSFMEDVAGAEKTFTVSAGEKQSKTIDLGTIALTSRDIIRAGAVAPDFTVKILDGGEWKLADHIGKNVVLLMWGAYQNREETRELANVAKRYASDPRITILGVYVAEDESKARLYIDRYGLDFPNTPDGAKIMTLYGNSWPSAVMIDADGHIAQKHLNPKVLEKYIKRTLEN